MHVYQRNFLRLLCVSSLTVTLVACQTATHKDIDNPPGHAAESTVQHPVASLPRHTQTAPQEKIASAPITDLWQRIRAGLQLQEYYDQPQVEAQLQRYINNQAYFDLTIERARPFLFAIVQELEKRGLPLELALLPFVESAFNPNAYSSEHAVGLWQFMGATAASFGLQQDWWYDARRDPQASTVAALDYLEELAQQFDQNWLLALAAYNAGDGNVRRAIRRKHAETGDNQFWDLALPRETRTHVPRVLALAKLVNESDHYGITLAPISNSAPLQRVEIGAQIDLAQVAQLAGMDYADLRNLNPGYLQWATHPDQPQSVLLPPAYAATLQAELSTLPRDQLLSWDHYQIQPGDTLGKIAHNLHTRVDVLQRVNNLRGTQIIAGRSLLIPRGVNAGSATVAPYLATQKLQSDSIPGSYRIRSGDNLWTIARRFDLHSSDIALWNGFEIDAVLRPGQVISLSPATNSIPTGSRIKSDITAITYEVRKGDSMARIATRFNTDLAELLKRNNLNANETIFPGQIIQIRQPQSGLN